MDPKNSELFNAMHCGSTCSLLVMFDDQIVSMSLGDSKSLLVTEGQQGLAPVCLSHDHNTANKQEVERVLKHGGRVQPIQLQNGDFVGPDRVWDKELRCPGLQVTRGFGDLVARKYGISGKPGRSPRLLTRRVQDAPMDRTRKDLFGRKRRFLGHGHTRRRCQLHSKTKFDLKGKVLNIETF